MSSLSGVGVLDKAISVLRALEREGPLSLARLQVESGLPRATAHRLAVALEAHGLVRRDADGRFALGLGLIALGHEAAEGFPLREAAMGALERLRDQTGESVQLWVREGDARRCVVSLQSPHGLRWIVPEGVLFPLDRGSAGRVLREDPSPPWVQSVEEREPGVASVSAPVLDRARRTIGAVSISGPIERVSREPAARFAPALVAAAASIAVS
jgi:DNA-binding IclR family transcriptional regulator